MVTVLPLTLSDGAAASFCAAKGSGATYANRLLRADVRTTAATPSAGQRRTVALWGLSGSLISWTRNAHRARKWPHDACRPLNALAAGELSSTARDRSPVQLERAGSRPWTNPRMLTNPPCTYRCAYPTHHRTHHASGNEMLGRGIARVTGQPTTRRLAYCVRSVRSMRTTLDE